jgi:hypothetical protein
MQRLSGPIRSIVINNVQVRCKFCRFATSTQPYYEVVGNLKYDRAALDAARKAVAGDGDGRVSVDDAQKILSKLLDGSSVTSVESRTAFMILRDFKFTDPARDLFIGTLASAE